MNAIDEFHELSHFHHSNQAKAAHLPLEDRCSPCLLKRYDARVPDDRQNGQRPKPLQLPEFRTFTRLCRKLGPYYKINLFIVFKSRNSKFNFEYFSKKRMLN